jgi:HPt (histidine-containing phosphotransfer) domain-containing protein
MTAYAMKEDRDRFMANGMNDYVPKPIRAEILVRKVAEWVNKKLADNSGQLAVKSTNSQISLSKSVDNLQSVKNDNLAITKNLQGYASSSTHNSQLNNYKVLDSEIIKQLSDSVGGDMSFVVSILEGFEEEATEQIANAIEGYNTNNCKQVQGELHTLKGNAGTLGAMRVHEITKIIEEKAKHCNFQLFDSEIIILKEEFDKFKNELSKMKNS